VEYIYLWHSTDVSCQAKQLQIDELLSKLNNAGGDLERLREDKEQEIMILQAAMDNTIEQLSDAQQV
jgi:huntingtin-interacting protein 1-related protein